MSCNLSRNLRLIFAVTTMLGAVVLAPIASAAATGSINPWLLQQIAAAEMAAARYAAAHKAIWVRQAVANWARHAPVRLAPGLAGHRGRR